jgi:isoaspartyl peptidase/L-asparaginase-like protein (Ntn-hydrolase superfamily)
MTTILLRRRYVNAQDRNGKVTVVASTATKGNMKIGCVGDIPTG